jgi:cysteine desulfurase
MSFYLESGTFADPARVHYEGQVVREAIEDARDKVAAFLHVQPREVVFTSSGTEAANTASRFSRRASNPSAPIISAGVEHSSVRLSSIRYGPVKSLSVDGVGRIEVDELEAMLDDAAHLLPSLVHCQFANHEVATRQPVEQVIALCRSHNVPVHVDACAAVGQMPIDFGAIGADLVSVSAHKFGGPTGIGALIVRRGTRISPLILGADEERGRRAGMENVLGILGFAAAAEVLTEPGALELAALSSRKATDRLIEAATSIPGVISFGDRSERVPNICCVGVNDVEAEGVVLGLDQVGIAVHSGSACSSEALAPSPVLEAMGIEANHSLRFSVGWSTTPADIEAFEACFGDVVASLRALSS